MVKLDTSQCQLLAKSKNYEEFVVNKDLMGFRKKKFGQKMSYLVLMWMAVYQDDSKLACKLVNEAKHITIGDTLKMKTYDCLRVKWLYSTNAVKQNLMDIYQAICAWFAPH